MPSTPPGDPRGKPTTMTTLIVLLGFFASGFAALTYEIAWIRKATLVFGSTSLALSTILAVFFLGWALGSWHFGRVSTRTDRPLRTFAILEICVGLFGLLSPWAFVAIESLYGTIYPAVSATRGTLDLTRAVLLMLCLLLPTVLMGGTLPLLCRHFVSNRDGILSTVGSLYGLNTLGGAVGCAVCGFVTIPALGVDAAIFIAAGLNLVLGFVVLRIAPTARLSMTGTDEATPHPGEIARPDETSRMIYPLFFATGFIALANEVIWTRYLAMLVRNNVYTYTLTLTVILVGIGLGGPLAGALLRRIKDGVLPFGLAQMALGVAGLGLLLHGINWWLHLASGDTEGSTTRLVVLVACLMLGPAILMGMSFPLAIRLAVARPSHTGTGVGNMTFVNTIGGVLGSLVTGFFLLPGIGLQTSILIVTGASVLLGLAALFTIRRTPPRAMGTKLAAAFITVPLWIGLAGTTRLQIPRDLLHGNGSILALDEGVDANLAVRRSEGVTRLEIDGLPQGEDRRSHLMMSAHVPMLLHPAPKSILVVGLGSGQAARRFLDYDIDRLDCVEIEGELPRLLRDHFDGAWMNDEKVRIIIEDGRSYLTNTDQKYDVISIAVGQTYRPGVASFYTEEFYRRARQAMRPGGCVSQFIPTQLLSTKEFRTLVATFVSAFPQSVLWYNTEEMLLIGRDVAAISVGLGRLETLTTNRAVHTDLQFSYWGGIQRWVNRPESFLGGLMLGPKGLAAVAADTAPYSDDRPWIEYTTARSRALDREQSGTIDLILKGLSPLSELLDGTPPDASLRFSETLRRQNLGDMRAVALARMVTSDEKITAKDAEVLLQRAIEWSPENVKIRRNLAYLLLDEKRTKDAHEAMKRALEIDPGDAVSHNVMGNVLTALGQKDEAIVEFKRSIELDDKNDVPRLNLGQILASLRQFERAAHHLKICVDQDPDSASAREWYGRVLGKQGKIVEAVAQLTRAIQLPRSSPAAAQNLAWMLATHERPDILSAEETVAMAEQMARATRDQSPAILDILAASYARAGRFPEAVAAATRAIDLAKEQKNLQLATAIESRRKIYQSGKPYLD